MWLSAILVAAGSIWYTNILDKLDHVNQVRQEEARLAEEAHEVAEEESEAEIEDSTV